MKFTKGPLLRTGFNVDKSEVSSEFGLECEDVSLTQQEFADDADINVLVKRFGLTGTMPPVVEAPSLVDVSEAPDFRTMQDMLVEARQSFMRLPAALRARFNHDAMEFCDFVQDSANGEELVRLGLAVKRPQEPAKPPESGEAGKAVAGDAGGAKGPA